MRMFAVNFKKPKSVKRDTRTFRTFIKKAHDPKYTTVLSGYVYEKEWEELLPEAQVGVCHATCHTRANSTSGSSRTSGASAFLYRL